MRSRPLPNPRRGLLRAGLTALVLILIAIGVVAIASSLAAPTAKAPGSGTVITVPTPPSTPGPLSTPRGQATPQASPTGTAGAKKHKDVSARRTHRTRSIALDRVPTSLLRSMRHGGVGETARHGSLLAWFRSIGHDSSSAQLMVSQAGRAALQIDRAEPYIRPVWSRDGSQLLYVAEKSRSKMSGAFWSLRLYNTRTHRIRLLAAQNALDLEPLGWVGGAPLYSVATQPDTTLRTARDGRSRQIAILMSQIITAPRLSPSSRYIAFVAPTNCRATCTLDIYDLATHNLWVGPTGVPNWADLAWSADGKSVVSVLNGEIGVTDAARETTSVFAMPSRLPQRWPHPFTAFAESHTIRLVDTVSGATYQTSRAGRS